MAGPVLLIHDDIAVIAPAKRVLQRSGIDTLLVTNAADAVITFGDLAPPVVVIAPEVDGGRGGSIAHEIRSHPRGGSTHFILLGTGLKEAPDAPVIPLPLDGSVLLDTVQRALDGEDITGTWHLAEPAAEPTTAPHEIDEALAEQVFEDGPTQAGAPPLELSAADEAPAGAPDQWFEADAAEAGRAVRQRGKEASKDSTLKFAGSAKQPVADDTLDFGQPKQPKLVDAAASAKAEEKRRREEQEKKAAEEKRQREEQEKKAAEEKRLEQKKKREEEERRAEERYLAEQKRKREEQEKKAAEEKRQREEEERKRAEAERLAEEKRAAEEKRLAQEKRRREEQEKKAAEEKRQREEQERREAEERAAELQRVAEAKRQREEEERLAAEELQRAEEERRAAEEKRLAEDKRRKEEQQRRAEEKRRREEEERAAEEARLAEEARERQEDERRAEERRAAEEKRRREAEERRRAEEARLAEEKRRLEDEEQQRLAEQAAREAELKRLADEQKRKMDELRRREEQERRRVEELKRAAEDEARRVAEEKSRLEQQAQQLAAEREEARRKVEAERQRAEEEARRAQELRALVDEQRRRSEEARLAAEEEERRVSEERRRLEQEAQELAQRTEEARRRAEEARQRLEEEARGAEEAQRLAAEEERRAAEARQREEQERARLEELRRASAHEASAAEGEVKRIEQEAAQIAQLREEARRKADAARKKLEDEQAAREAEERRTRETLEAAERQSRERVEAAKRALQVREEQVRRDQELRQLEQQTIRQREEDALREQQAAPSPKDALFDPNAADPGGRLIRPFAAGRWRGPRRVTELASDAVASAAGEEAGKPPSLEARAAAAAEEGFKAGPPAAPTAAPFSARGTLKLLDAPTLVCRAFDARLTGRLDVSGPDAQRTLWFEEGRLVAAASSSLVERLEEIALRMALITRAQHHALRTSEEKLARRLALQMVELGYLRPNEMYPLVKQRVLDIAFSIFLDDESTYVYTPECPPAEERVVVPLHPYALATEGIRRKFSAERLWSRLGGPATLMRPRAQSPELDYFGFGARERRLAGTVDGLRTLEEVLFEGGMEEVAALKVLYALIAGGAMEIAVLGQAARPTTPAEAARLDLARVSEKYNQVISGDYFQMLGLRRDATSYEVREAYDRLSREFHPDRFVSLPDGPLFNRLDEIGRALAEAADVLADDVVRQEYARSLVE